MSTKNKKIVYYLAAFLVVLMLVCTCLLGNTFARYVTSGTSGTGSATIADWSVNGTWQSSGSISFSDLSPNDDKYESSQTGTVSANSSGYDANGYRWNSSAAVQILTITNASDVKASVTIDIGTKSLDYDGSLRNITSVEYSSGNYYTEAQVTGLFSLYLCDSNGSAFTTGNITGGSITAASNTSVTVTLDETSGSITIYGYAVWTTCDSLTNTLTDDGAAADKLDTLVAQNVGSVSWAIDWTAVQYSEVTHQV